VTHISNAYRSVHWANPLHFAGKLKHSKESSTPDGDESDASSIHTNPETNQMVSAVDQTLDKIKSQISAEDWALLSKAKIHFVDEVNRMKHSGRKWQRDADNIGTEFMYTSDQLEKKERELTQALKAKQELEQKYAEQGKKLKATEIQLEEQLQDGARIDAEIERLSREANEIKEKLGNVL